MPKSGYALSHMELYVTDMERMIAFYTDVLGFVVTDGGQAGERRLVFLSRHPAEHHQVVLCTGRPPESPNPVLNHISFRVDDLDTLRGVLERIRPQPYGPIEQVTHGIAWSLYFRDPEGNRLECFVDTPWYSPQPLRETLDFAQSDEEIRTYTEALVRGRPGFRSRTEWQQELAAKFANA